MPLGALLGILKIVSERVIAYRNLKPVVGRMKYVADDLEKRFERAKNSNTMEDDNITGHQENFDELKKQLDVLSGWYQIILYPFSREKPLSVLKAELDSLRNEVLRIAVMAEPLPDDEDAESTLSTERDSEFEYVSLHPLRDARDNAGDNPEVLREACMVCIIENNCRRSLDEWRIAHELLMKAVSSEAIPREREHEGKNWMNELYRQVVKLGVTEQEARDLDAVFREAESNHIIGHGAADILAVAVTRQDGHLVHTIHILFERQAQLNARQDVLLDYVHKRALLTWFACFVLVSFSLIPVVRSLTIPLSFIVIFVVKWICRGPVRSSSMLGKQIQKRMARSEWKHTTLEKGSIDEDAARNLGISKDALLAQLHWVRTQRPAPTIGAEDEHSSTNGVPEHNRGSAERDQPDGGRDGDVSTPTREPNDAETHVRNVWKSELDKWKCIGLVTGAFVNVGSEEIAGAVSAFLVDYNHSQIESYGKLRKSLWSHFHPRCIYGSSFVDADQDVQVKLMEVGSLAISEVTTGDAAYFLTMRMNRFIRQVCVS